MTGESILAVLCLLGAMQGLLLAAAVASLESGLRRANRVLAAILFGAAIVMVIILGSHRLVGEWQWVLEILEYLLWGLSGPLFYLYVRVAVGRDAWPTARFAFHFAPGLAWLVYVAAWWLAGGADRPWSLQQPPVVAMILYQMAYTGLGLLCWWRDWRKGPEPLPAPHDFAVPAALGALVLQHLAQWTRWVFRTEPVLVDVVPLAGAATFVALAFGGLRRALPQLGRSRRRYAGSSLTPTRAEDVAGRLDALMSDEQPFLRPELTLEELAGELSVPKTHLSQVINERFGKSFTEYVAAYRLRESERLLLDESTSHLTIEALARRSGFRSRSAFYDAFRRHNGVTPSEFRKRGSGRTR